MEMGRAGSGSFILKTETPHMDGDSTEHVYEQKPQWEVAHFHSHW